MYRGSQYDPQAPGIVSSFQMTQVLYCPDLKFNLLSISQGLKEGFDFQFPAVNKCQIIAPTKDWYMMAPHDKRTALFCLEGRHLKTLPDRDALRASVVANDYELLFQAFRKFWASWFDNPNIDTNLGGALHPMYRRPPKENITLVASRMFHPTIVENDYPILRTVCTSILELIAPHHPDFRLNRMLVGLLGESRLTNEAIVRLWHRRLGHPGDSVLNELIHVNPDLKHLRGRRLPQLRCDSCRYAKSTRQPFKDRAVFRSTIPGQRIVSDIWGPFRVPSIGGAKYFVIFVDDFSRYTWLYLMKSRKDLRHSYSMFRSDFRRLFHAEILELHHMPSDDIDMLHMDNAQEYISLRDHLHREGSTTRCHFSMAYSPSQNGIAERRIGLIVLKIRCLLLEGDLPEFLWGRLHYMQSG